MENLFIEALKDWPWALVFSLFLVLSFRQRAKTMDSMVDMVSSFMDTIGKCCDEGGD